MSQPMPPTDAERRRFLLEMLPHGSVGAEIGVHLGDFSQVILDGVAPRHLHLIDPWSYQPSAEYERALYGGRAERGQTEMDERHVHRHTHEPLTHAHPHVPDAHHGHRH